MRRRTRVWVERRQAAMQPKAETPRKKKTGSGGGGSGAGKSKGKARNDKAVGKAGDWSELESAVGGGSGKKKLFR